MLRVKQFDVKQGRAVGRFQVYETAVHTQRFGDQFVNRARDLGIRGLRAGSADGRGDCANPS